MIILIKFDGHFFDTDFMDNIMEFLSKKEIPYELINYPSLFKEGNLKIDFKDCEQAYFIGERIGIKMAQTLI